MKMTLPGWVRKKLIARLKKEKQTDIEKYN